MTSPRISFEFFPPQSVDASFRLWDAVQDLAPLRPDFVSVTYGAGGSARDKTLETAAAIGQNCGLQVAAHLTC
ncbi:MAG: methylenetetrahydrofolate reductase, partial [Tabrizicola sp.]|nr:methylenetetrahydrofolate reductase [Tabrizicola sp.]